MDYFSTERKEVAEKDVEGTGDSEDFALMEQLSRETRGNGFLQHRKEGLGERCPSRTQTGGWGRRGHLERSARARGGWNPDSYRVQRQG